MALQRCHVLAVLQADQMIGKNGFPGVDSSLGCEPRFHRPNFLRLALGRTIRVQTGQRSMDTAEQIWYRVGPNRICPHVGHRDLGGQRENPIGTLCHEEVVPGSLLARCRHDRKSDVPSPGPPGQSPTRPLPTPSYTRILSWQERRLSDPDGLVKAPIAVVRTEVEGLWM